MTSRVSANAGYDSSTSSSSGSGSICSSSSNSSSSNSTNPIKRPVITTQIRSVSALASITDRSSIRPVMTSSSSSLSLSHREASSSNQRSKLCTKRVDGHAARADAISRIDRNKHDMREDLSEGPHLSYDSFRGSASRNLSIIGEKNMETENVREIERVKEIRSEQMANRHNENFDREKTRSVSYDSRLNFASTTNRLNVHSNTNPVSASYVGTSSPFSSSNSSSYSSSSSALPSSSPSSSFRMSITPSKSSQFSTFSANSSSSASSFYRASSSLSSSSSSSFYPSTSSLSSSGYPSSPFPISNYPCRSVSASSSFPSSSSSLNSVDFRSSSRSANTIYDMTTIDDSDDENEEEKQKRDRVIALIKSLTQLTDKQQMIKQILEKYQVKLITAKASFVNLRNFTVLSSLF